VNSAATEAVRSATSAASNGEGVAAITALVGRAASILAKQAAAISTNPLIPSNVNSDSTRTGPNLDTPVVAQLSNVASSPLDPERVRRQAHEMIETLLTVFSPRLPPGEQVPVLSSAAPVEAGRDASVTIRVANEEGEPTEAALYCSNFIGDSGYDIPSLRATFSPRMATIAPNSEAAFQIRLAIPQQTPPGVYSGLVQAAGTRYVKAVVSFQVT
jgi:hypothetical protein